MSYKEKDIVFELKNFWVLRDTKKKAYHVMKIGISVSESDSSYALNEDGLSIAITRANYLQKRFEEKQKVVASSLK